jgi:hypothetical protein
MMTDDEYRKGRKAMNTLTEAIRKHHLNLAKTLDALARGVGGGEPQAERDAFVAFLKGDLLPMRAARNATCMVSSTRSCGSMGKRPRP